MCLDPVLSVILEHKSRTARTPPGRPVTIWLTCYNLVNLDTICNKQRVTQQRGQQYFMEQQQKTNCIHDSNNVMLLSYFKYKIDQDPRVSRKFLIFWLLFRFANIVKFIKVLHSFGSRSLQLILFITTSKFHLYFHCRVFAT